MAEEKKQSSIWKRAAVVGAVVLGGLGFNMQQAEAATQPQLEENKTKVETKIETHGHTMEASNSALKQQILDLQSKYVELGLNQKRFPAQAEQFKAQQQAIRAQLAPLLLQYKAQQEEMKSQNKASQEKVESSKTMSEQEFRETIKVNDGKTVKDPRFVNTLSKMRQQQFRQARNDNTDKER